MLKDTTQTNVIFELHVEGAVSACQANGEELTGEAFEDLRNCMHQGDCEDSCRYFIETHKPEFRIVKVIDGEFQNVIASHADKAEICKTIYFESDTDFDGDEKWCDVYLTWQASAEIVNA